MDDCVVHMSIYVFCSFFQKTLFIYAKAAFFIVCHASNAFNRSEKMKIKIRRIKVECIRPMSVQSQKRTQIQWRECGRFSKQAISLILFHGVFHSFPYIIYIFFSSLLFLILLFRFSTVFVVFIFLQTRYSSLATVVPNVCN